MSAIWYSLHATRPILPQQAVTRPVPPNLTNISVDQRRISMPLTNWSRRTWKGNGRVVAVGECGLGSDCQGVSGDFTDMGALADYDRTHFASEGVQKKHFRQWQLAPGIFPEHLQIHKSSVHRLAACTCKRNTTYLYFFTLGLAHADFCRDSSRSRFLVRMAVEALGARGGVWSTVFTGSVEEGRSNTRTWASMWGICRTLVFTGRADALITALN